MVPKSALKNSQPMLMSFQNISCKAIQENAELYCTNYKVSLHSALNLFHNTYI